MTSSLSTLVALLAADVQARPRGNFDASALAPTVAPTPVHGGVAVARVPGRGAPSLMWTPRGEPQPASRSPEAAARAQLGRHLDAYGVTPDVIAAARTLFVHDTGRGGIIVALRQTVDGVDLHHGDVKLLLDRSRRLLAVSGALHPDAHPGAARPFATTPADAITTALRDLHGDAVHLPLVEIAGRSQWRHFTAAHRHARPDARALRLLAPARARPVYFPVGEALVAAHLVELQTRLGARDDVYQYVIAADDGRLLMRRDGTLHAHSYRVQADPGDYRPFDGPLQDFNPHPTGAPGVIPELEEYVPYVTVEGLNTNPEGVPDPWLPANATETVGNNVDAYLDLFDSDPVNDRFRATVTAPGVFDRAYDFSQAATADDEQIMTALTHIFYVTNWQHDWWYDAGLVEATGAAQTDNYGRGGEDGDPMRIESLNGANVGQRNNASVSFTLDGGSPRMRMLIFEGLSALETLTVQPLGLQLEGQVAAFGPKAYDVTAPLVLASGDACAPLGDEVQGKIVLVDRSACTFETQVKHLDAAGAVGALIADDVAADEPLLASDDLTKIDPTTPTVGITLADGDALKAALADAELTVHMAATQSPTRDSSLDSMLIAHEYGHFVHNRLVECGTPTCLAQSEGWGDFNALLMSMRDGDDLDAVVNYTPWATTDPTRFFNGRQYVYSTDLAVDPLTFKHIGDDVAAPASPLFDPNGLRNSEQHNAGQVWNSMLWDSLVALHELHADDLGFEAVRRRMSDYVVAGMMLAPIEPTYTEQRDALLMAIAATSEEDMLTVAAAFAARGAGSCAESPPRFSTTLEHVVEDYELRGRGVLLDATLDDSPLSCDDDGLLDDGEAGRITFNVYNGGVAPLAAGATVEVVEPPAGLVFPDGPVFVLPELAPQQTSPGSISVALADGVTGPTRLSLRVRLTTPGACEAPAEQIVHTAVSADLAPTGASEDDVEVAAAWTATGDDAALVWARVPGIAGHAWQGQDRSVVTDTALVSPPFTVAKGQKFSLHFDHAYKFDTFSGYTWDGGVIEVSNDDGATWHDVSELLGDFGYNGAIVTDVNPLFPRAAFVAASPGYPKMNPMVLDFGEKLAGLTLRLRFRIATNPVVSAAGWTLDNFRFEGLADAPFPQWVADAGVCTPEPDAPTTGEPTTGPDEPADTSAGDSETDGPSLGDDGGCGCDADPRGGWIFGLALPLLALRRRRTCA